MGGGLTDVCNQHLISLQVPTDTTKPERKPDGKIATVPPVTELARVDAEWPHDHIIIATGSALSAGRQVFFVAMKSMRAQGRRQRRKGG